jgi:hypothetical protein
MILRADGRQKLTEIQLVFSEFWVLLVVSLVMSLITQILLTHSGITTMVWMKLARRLTPVWLVFTFPLTISLKS